MNSTIGHSITTYQNVGRRQYEVQFLWVLSIKAYRCFAIPTKKQSYHFCLYLVYYDFEINTTSNNQKCNEIEAVLEKKKLHSQELARIIYCILPNTDRKLVINSVSIVYKLVRNL